MLKQRIKEYATSPLWRASNCIVLAVARLQVLVILRLAKYDSQLTSSIIKKRCKPIIWLDTIKLEQRFIGNESVDIYKPNYDEIQDYFVVDKPPIGLYKFNNAKVHGKSSHLILNNAIIMERLPCVPVELCNYATGFIRAHDNSFAVYRNKYQIVDVDKAFFLGGNGSWNYYHWTIEIIAKLKYFLSSGLSCAKIKIIVPEEAKNIASFSAMLEVLVGDACDFIYISQQQVAQVQELYVINTPSNVVFNSIKGAKIKSDFVFFDKTSVDYIRESVLNSPQYKHFLNGSDKKIAHKKVFLARKDFAVRGYNQSEVLKVVTDYGFQPIYLEELSFFEQVYLFQNVDCVIGASGAAWTNLIYIKQGAKGLSWLSENISSFSNYSTLAKYYGCQLKFFKNKEKNKYQAHSSYSIDLKMLENNLINHFSD